MPYARNSEMPSAITDNVPDAGQTIMRNVINSQLDRGLSETRAFASAWAALSRAGYEKDPEGRWVETDKMSPTPSAVHVPSTDWGRGRRRTRKELSASARQALESKVTEHNAEHGDKGRVSLPMLEQVYNRGVGAYRTNPGSVRPSVNSPEQWAMARVNVFLRAIRTGRFPSGKVRYRPAAVEASAVDAEGIARRGREGRVPRARRGAGPPLQAARQASSKKFGRLRQGRATRLRRVTFRARPTWKIRRDDPAAPVNFPRSALVRYR
jgi:Putative cation transport regulator